MTIHYLKKGIDEQERSTENNKVKNIVEETLKKIEQQGDLCIRELSEKFDNYSPKSFKLSNSEIQIYQDEVKQKLFDGYFAIGGPLEGAYTFEMYCFLKGL